MTITLDQLTLLVKPGDILLYGEYIDESIFDKIVDNSIAWKTASDADHVEIVSDITGRSWASRNGTGLGTGVGSYILRTDGLVSVRRPLGFDIDGGLKRFKTLDGIPYGFCDIKIEIGLEYRPTGLDCSHFAAMIMQGGFANQFDKNFDKRRISPRDFELSTESDQIWPSIQTA
jgi:hypothetical protein